MVPEWLDCFLLVPCQNLLCTLALVSDQRTEALRDTLQAATVTMAVRPGWLRSLAPACWPGHIHYTLRTQQCLRQCYETIIQNASLQDAESAPGFTGC